MSGGNTVLTCRSPIIRGERLIFYTHNANYRPVAVLRAFAVSDRSAAVTVRDGCAVKFTVNATKRLPRLRKPINTSHRIN